MPWEKNFDTDLALQQAMKVFWDKGYDATSMADLTKAMGINKGSLYNAFGGKKALFVKAVLKYDLEHRREAIAQLEALDDPIRAFGMLFDGLIAESLADKEKKGCLLVNTALELPSHDGEIRAIVTGGLQDFESYFRRGIEVAQKRGDISASIDAPVTAKGLLTLVVGLRVLARGVFDENGLQAIKTQAMGMLAQPLAF
ncbi:TetR/AcrR family transcriptional regulator [Algisphaera agarilytica]|uniref:TetR/AcrR family transcriptional repressor of nem operon n=1 Tax=Algisphaera agarilytica TaxID=1385975 RepID=A0A7X0H5Z3_9BACT|nr:TetR/AcrR family transcriptional regulator [Algisphaera agarilytica]MBB6429923.1 TetR/AcrR family transcriptional repressor of nem operon [Algisphaera agarilytica]